MRETITSEFQGRRLKSWGNARSRKWKRSGECRMTITTFTLDHVATLDIEQPDNT